MTILDDVELAPADPILGLTEAFRSDGRSGKVNLGVGVYLGQDGKLPLMRAVRSASGRITADLGPRGYQPIDGIADYDRLTRELVFGKDSEPVTSKRVTTVQTLGGTGALKIAADFLRSINPDAKVLISSPSWENHRALFTRAEFLVEEYRYYSESRRGIDFDGMVADLNAAEAGTIVVLHACCHNPTGYDLDERQWGRVIEIVRDRQLVPLLDMAYQGFGFGIEADGAVVTRFAAAGMPVFVATSFSKSFGLYGERVGALHVVSPDAQTASRVLSQVKICIRTNYSNPPTYGAALVATVLGDPELRREWEMELASMRDRIKDMRSQLVTGLRRHGIEDMDFILEQLGMFSYSGLSKDQMDELRTKYAIYGTSAGRMCVAALNEDNIEQVVGAIAAVRKVGS